MFYLACSLATQTICIPTCNDGTQCDLSSQPCTTQCTIEPAVATNSTKGEAVTEVEDLEAMCKVVNDPIQSDSEMEVVDTSSYEDDSFHL